MKLLLDLHIFLWMILESHRLPATVVTALNDSSNRRHLSVVSIWELQIKVSTGKLILPDSIQQFVATYRSINNIATAAISEEHIWTLGNLPLHHRDPFDRLLIAQAIHEGYTLVTADPIFKAYPVKRLG